MAIICIIGKKRLSLYKMTILMLISASLMIFGTHKYQNLRCLLEILGFTFVVIIIFYATNNIIKLIFTMGLIIFIVILQQFSYPLKI